MWVIFETFQLSFPSLSGSGFGKLEGDTVQQPVATDQQGSNLKPQGAGASWGPVTAAPPASEAPGGAQSGPGVRTSCGVTGPRGGGKSLFSPPPRRISKIIIFIEK